MLLSSKNNLSKYVEELRNPVGTRRIEAPLLIGLLVGAITLLVYQQGGTQSVYPHLMYLPILFAAFYFKLAGGLIVGIAAGLALGPFMPLNVAAEIPQSTLNWLIRSGFFVLVGLMAGLGFEVLNARLNWLRQRAYYDPLTGLPNLTALRDYLHQLPTDRAMPCNPATELLIVFNIVNLTEVVNTLGYEKSDQVIQQLAKWLHQILPQASMLARTDSNKFTAVLVEEDLDPLMTFRKLRQINLQTEDVPIHVETSIGIVHFPDAGDDLDSLIPMAEVVANRAFMEGTGIALYTHEQDSQRKENLRLLGELQQAIEKDQLLLHYQPKLHIATGQIIGVEALIRWPHPQLGFIPPDKFIPLAECTALVEPLTRWVLKTALSQLAEWQHSGLDLGMALNLSSRNLQERDLLSRIARLLDAYGIESKRLTLEITEGAMMHLVRDTIGTLTSLRNQGVNIAVDDFGIGYSCLAYLSQLPVNSLKLDRSFITHLQTSHRDKVIVQTVIDLCHQLGIEVVAEGIETPDMLDLLTRMGCDLAQGYHIGRPLPAQDLEQQVRTGFKKDHYHLSVVPNRSKAKR